MLDSTVTCAVVSFNVCCLLRFNVVNYNVVIARLYGLAKVHKKNIPMRPVLSMPGSAYHGVAQDVSNWLSVPKVSDKL